MTGRPLFPAGTRGQCGLFHDLGALVRVRVSCMAAACAGLGYVFIRPRADLNFLYCVAGTFLLASACSILNQVQERGSDALMRRTRQRPLAARRLSCRAALLTAALCFSAACLLLWSAGGMGPLLCAPLALVLYNGLYTPLKKRTGFALLVGALAGALPLPVGWLAAGAGPAEPSLVVLFGLYYIWQVPHFWLRAERHRQDYARAGFPLPAIRLRPERSRALFGLWCCALAVTLLLLPVFPLVHSLGARLALAVLGLAALLCSLLFQTRRRPVWGNETASALTDGLLLAATLVLVSDRLFSSLGIPG